MNQATTATKTSEPTTVDKLRGLPWAIAGSAANIVFVKLTFFGSVFVLFLSELGMNKTQTGFLLSLMPYFGLAALFAAPFVVRNGFKRSFVTFWGLRQVATFGILLTPWINATFGAQAMFIYITVIIVWFAFCRAIGETAHMPWQQEYIPNSIRGKFSAKNSVISTSVSFVAVLTSSFVIGKIAGLSGYLLLFFIGGVAGVLGVWFYTHIPGGAPRRKIGSEPSIWQDMLVALHDRNFLLFMLGISCVILAMTPLASFVPLFMQEQVGISAGFVILLQIGALLGTLLFSYVWGWSADRYGSKPVLMVTIALRIMVPILYMFTPRSTELSLPYAMTVSMIQGLVDVGWMISSSRLLYVGVVPPEKKSEYMALHFAWIGLVGGTSQLLAGRLVDLSSGLNAQLGMLPVDPYTPLFLLSFLFAGVSAIVFLRVRADAQYGVAEFARMFLRGNPLMAVNSLVRYQFAKDEYAAIQVTERLGSAKSPLAVDELLEVLKDPRFNVRFEAIVAMARTQPDERVVDALIETLDGTELALGSLSAWALGRLGDPIAIQPLRSALDKPYHSIRVQSIRALAALGDHASAAEFYASLQQETDRGLQMAYAASLGKLGYTAATQELLDLLYEFKNEGARLELALAIARLSGDEHYFIQLVRQVRDDPGTAMSQAISAIKRDIESEPREAELDLLLNECASVLAHADVERGAELLGRIALTLAENPDNHFSLTARTILLECGTRLAEFHDQHIEYILLTLHTMHAGLRTMQET